MMTKNIFCDDVNYNCDVTDKYLMHLFQSKAQNLRMTGRTLLFAAILLKLKSNVLEGLDVMDFEPQRDDAFEYSDEDHRRIETFDLSNYLIHTSETLKNELNPSTSELNLEMLLEASGKGAIVDLEDIPKAKGIEWDTWLKMYPGSGFVFTASEKDCEAIIDYLAKFSITAAVVGDVIDDESLFVVSGDEKIELFNQKINPVFKGV